MHRLRLTFLTMTLVLTSFFIAPPAGASTAEDCAADLSGAQPAAENSDLAINFLRTLQTPGDGWMGLQVTESGRALLTTVSSQDQSLSIFEPLLSADAVFLGQSDIVATDGIAVDMADLTRVRIMPVGSIGAQALLERRSGEVHVAYLQQADDGRAQLLLCRLSNLDKPVFSLTFEKGEIVHGLSLIELDSDRYLMAIGTSAKIHVLELKQITKSDHSRFHPRTDLEAGSR